MRKWERELRRIPGVEDVRHTNGDHLRLLLTNGRFVITGSTTGDQRASFIMSIARSGANCVGLAIIIPMGANIDRAATSGARSCDAPCPL
jgi:hypothetical protein